MSDSKQACWPGWETVRLIGRGSFGEVYEIRRQICDTTVKAALKMISIPQNRSDIEALYDDGYDEASITATFQSHLESIVAEYSMMEKMKGCANVVNCDDIFYEKQSNGIGWDIYIKMELLQPIGQTLPKDADVPEDTVIKLAQDMCAALELCRKHGIIHRDIKPQNIFLSKHGDYKLGDFGIAKTVEKTMGGTKIGTYKYMAPEVYNNQPYGTAVDIYSLGLVMYWLLNKRRMPFLPLPPQKMTSGMEEESRRRRFSGEPLPAPATGSDELKRIVLKACAFDPAERYSTAAELLEDLNRLAGLPVPVPESPDPPVDDPVPPQPPAPPTPPVDRLPVKESTKKEAKRKPVWFGVAAGLVALIAIIILLFRGCGTEEPKNDPTDGQTEPSSSVQTTEEAYEMKLNTDRLSVFEGATATLEVSGIPEDANVKWSSSDKAVAKVDSDGEISGIGVGVATITVAWVHNGETYEVSAEVTVTSAGVTLNEYTIADFYIGETRQLVATTSPADGKVEWKSSDPSIVTISADGTVTAVCEGSATITVTFGEYTESCSVTVAKPAVVLSGNTAKLYIGDKTSLQTTTKPAGLTVSWSSDNTSVATVSDGTVQAVSAGTAKISAKINHQGNTYESICTVTVLPPSIDIDNGSISLLPGETKTLSVSTEPAGMEVSWSSSNTSVATVSGGKITAIAPGSVTITSQITYAGKTYKDSCSVTVGSPSISLSADWVSLAIGQTAELRASTTPSGASVSWFSSNTSVATVSGGKVKAVASGNATITATITVGGKSYSATCSVTVAEPTISVTSSSDTITYAEREQDRETCTLTADVTPDGGTIEWSSSNASVAQVSGNGTTATVKAISDGSVTITAMYTVKGKIVKDSCEITVRKAASTLKVSNVVYPRRSKVDDFYFDADVSSNYQLTKLFISGKATSNATQLSVTDSATFHAASGIYETGSKEAAEITEFMKDRYRAMYDLYVGLAGLLGVDKSVTITIDATFYDSSGNSFSFTMIYILEES